MAPFVEHFKTATLGKQLLGTNYLNFAYLPNA